MFTTQAKKILFISSIIGLIIGVAFIYVQPLFGMSPLTNRHAAGYMKLGYMSEGSAIFVAWSIHLFISICYGLATGIALIISKKVVPFILQVFALGWLTTLIAPPANALIVKLVGTGAFPALSSLPALNYSIDAKLILHIVFFGVIAIILWAYKKVFDKSSQLASQL